MQMDFCRSGQVLTICQQGSDMLRKDASGRMGDGRKKLRAGAGAPAGARGSAQTLSPAATWQHSPKRFLFRDPVFTVPIAPRCCCHPHIPHRGGEVPLVNTVQRHCGSKVPLLPFWGCSVSRTPVWGLLGGRQPWSLSQEE